jgi:hypothetical protein
MLRHWRLDLLLVYGTRVGARTNSGKTALDYARKYEHPAAADALLLAADAAADAAAAAAADAAAAAAVAAAAVGWLQRLGDISPAYRAAVVLAVVRRV